MSATNNVPDGKPCGQVCGLPDDDGDLRRVLSPEQYRVMRENGTELAFQNAYWDNEKPGVYADALTGAPLFSSAAKFDSGTGWPSFWAPLEPENLYEKRDSGQGMGLVEVRAAQGDNHLGHLFDDGPQPTGIRYCINSAALRFVQAEYLDAEGYGRYARLFPDVRQVAHPPGRRSFRGIPADVAMFGAGCFWGVEAAFRSVPGVLETSVGFSGGSAETPSYRDVCTGLTGHAEVVRVVFDPAKTSYADLLAAFWNAHDPTQKNRQGPDVGTQYRSAVFFFSPGQEDAARKSLRELEGSGRLSGPVVTEISPAGRFYRAEEYHQRYLEKNRGAVCRK